MKFTEQRKKDISEETKTFPTQNNEKRNSVSFQQLDYILHSSHIIWQRYYLLYYGVITNTVIEMNPILLDWCEKTDSLERPVFII